MPICSILLISEFPGQPSNPIGLSLYVHNTFQTWKVLCSLFVQTLNYISRTNSCMFFSYVKLLCKELNKQRWLMVKTHKSGDEVRMSRYRNGLESEGLGFNLCVAPPRVVVSLISRDRSRIGDRRSEVGDDFIVKTKVGQGRQERNSSHGARRGLMSGFLHYFPLFYLMFAYLLM